MQMKLTYLCLQSALQVTLVTAAVKPVPSASIATGRVTTSRDSVTVCRASRGHCATRVSSFCWLTKCECWLFKC